MWITCMLLACNGYPTSWITNVEVTKNMRVDNMIDNLYTEISTLNTDF